MATFYMPPLSSEILRFAQDEGKDSFTPRKRLPRPDKSGLAMTNIIRRATFYMPPLSSEILRFAQDEGKDSFTPRICSCLIYQAVGANRTKVPCSFRTIVLIYIQSWKLRFGFAEWVRMGFAHWVMRDQKRKVD